MDFILPRMQEPGALCREYSTQVHSCVLPPPRPAAGGSLQLI